MKAKTATLPTHRITQRKQTAGERVFMVFNYTFMILLCITMLYPFIYLAMSSISKFDLSSNGFSIIPRGVTFSFYERVLANPSITTGYINTILRTVLGTGLSLIVTLAMAYPLSKKTFPHRNFWTGLVVFTMFFSGGIIPTYLLVKSLGITDSIWSLVLPEMVSAFNLIIVRNYMQTIPDSLEESAKMDGANDITVLFRIILPVCAPIIATITLWVAVWHWNAWYDAMVYISSPSNEVIQLVMRRIVLEGSDALTQMMSSSLANDDVTPDGIKSATIMITTIPILCAYPFVQKYFVKGIMVGSLKG
jgi:putative aldouronate transport system permease protein